jgi:diguanylate cyclase (GGDEF)-like protein
LGFPFIAGEIIGTTMSSFQRILGCLLIWLTIQAASATPSQLPDRLVIANSASWVPYSFLDKEGEPRGILVDLWRLFAEANGIEVEFILADWADSIALVETGAADLHGGLIETEARKKALHFFPTEIFRVRSLVFWHAKEAKRDLAALRGVNVGVVAASTEEEFMRANFSNLLVKTYPNSERLVEAAISREISIFVSDYPTGYYHLISLQRLDEFDTGPTLFTRPIFAATGPGDTELLTRIDAGTKKLSRREIQRVKSRWFIPKEPLAWWIIPAATTAVVLMLLTAFTLHFRSLRRTIKAKTAALQASLQELETANARLDRLARTDPLTGLPNRLAFFGLAPRETERASRYGRPLSLAIFDLDNFKAINDRYGHASGDMALKHFATTVTKLLRPSDLFARIGGEEFAVLLPETDPSEAARMLERILKSVMEASLKYLDEDISLSFSAGVTGYFDGASVDELMKYADVALYRSKAEGRARISVNLPTNPTN